MGFGPAAGRGRPGPCQQGTLLVSMVGSEWRACLELRDQPAHHHSPKGKRPCRRTQCPKGQAVWGMAHPGLLETACNSPLCDPDQPALVRTQQRLWPQRPWTLQNLDL